MLVDLGFVTPEQVAETRAGGAVRRRGRGGLAWSPTRWSGRPTSPRPKPRISAPRSSTSARCKIEDDVIAAIPRHIAQKYRVVPVYKHDNSLTVAIADPSDLDTIDSLTHLLHTEINLQVASEADIEAALGKYYGGRGATAVDQDDPGHHRGRSRDACRLEDVAAAEDGGGGGGGRAAHQAGQLDDRRGVQDAGLGHSPRAAGQDGSACATALTGCCTR